MDQKYLRKYLKYKNKYLNLKNKIGGNDERDRIIKHCNTYDKPGEPLIYDKTECPHCPFTNAGKVINGNVTQSSCTKIDVNANYCFNLYGNTGRFDDTKFINGKSKIILENNIEYVEPEGEVCFGNAITSCTTYCFILNDNSKICAHLNLPSNVINKLFNLLNYDIVDYENIFHKVIDLMGINGKTSNPIKKIIITTVDPLYIYTNTTTKNKVICTQDIEIISQYSEIKKVEGDGGLCDLRNFLNVALEGYLLSNYQLVYKENFKTENGHIYLIKEDIGYEIRGSSLNTF